MKDSSCGLGIEGAFSISQTNFELLSQKLRLFTLKRPVTLLFLAGLCTE